ncbi:lamin tail domain-containing protein [Haloechinothrix halophila]|uniref:lamin tail domain-containing protein n=1 Tax=Haloechinothrix halophila TaxID=1069073 RepID=UPI00146FB1EB|nr:lamin tail domain-containing protein [Haloechinothrix halophila]
MDLGETAWNSTTSSKAKDVAQKIRGICGISSGPVHLDYVMASHHHLDHIGYAGNPNDTDDIGNGIYELLTPATEGGLGFTVGTLYDRDGGVWTDANGDADCDIGTSSNPAPEVDWHNAGTTSQTARRWNCWLYGPAGQADRAHIEGKVDQLTNTETWPTLDLGTGVTTTIVQVNGKDVMQADGTTPVSGDHTAATTPPSENDYSIALDIQYGVFSYVTAGDNDGEYDTSSFGYTYNDIESHIAEQVGATTVARANHHGSTHSSSSTYLNTLNPQVGVISCGNNSYGHPANRVLDAFRNVSADIYLTNNPCDDTDPTGAPIDYSGTFNNNGDIVLQTSGTGDSYDVTYDSGTNSYTTGNGSGGGSGGDPSQVKVNEFLMAPSTNQEWVELYNPTADDVDVSGHYIDDLAASGSSPQQIPSGTVIPAGGYWVMELGTAYLNNTGTEDVRFLEIVGEVETVYDSYTYSLSSSEYDQVFHRVGDGGSWCDTISSNVTQGTANPSTCP